jgi:hypothetical protein
MVSIHSRTQLARLLTTFMVGALLGRPVSAADLSSIPRTIQKEPAYRSKPGYCLLVLGQQADTRLCLVLDNDVLYVDRDRTGDLTAPECRVVADKQGIFHIGKITEKGTAISHDVQVRRFGPGDGPEKETLYFLRIKVSGHRQSSCFAFARNPNDAPVLHFNGPLTMGLGLPPTLYGLNEIELHAFVGIQGWAKGKSDVLTQLGFENVPAGICPMAEIDFPSKSSPGKSIHVKVSLKHRC